MLWWQTDTDGGGHHMTRDDIIRMIREAGGILRRGTGGDWCEFDFSELERFAALVAAREREACCSIVHGQCESDNVAQRTVDAIRARGNHAKG